MGKVLDTQYFGIAIPEKIENLQLPDPSLLTYYKNIEDRVLWIDDEISVLSLEYAKQIMQWNREDQNIPVTERKPIKLLFFSPGGDLQVNNLLIDTIQMSTTKVIGINCGEASSSACFIFLSCHERYTFPSARFLIHKGSGKFEGQYDEVISAIYDYQRSIENIGKFVMERTNIPQEVFEENFSTDWYITAEEAIEYGMCEKVITSLDEIYNQ